MSNTKAKTIMRICREAAMKELAYKNAQTQLINDAAMMLDGPMLEVVVFYLKMVCGNEKQKEIHRRF